LLILEEDKCQLTIKGIKFLQGGVYSDVGMGYFIKNYFFE
jgi:hypothetical protein